jgi:PleD family two-component response regulator
MSHNEKKGIHIPGRLLYNSNDRCKAEQDGMMITSILKNKKIIVMDDDPTQVEFLSVILSKYGADVTGTTNASEAMELVRERLPDLFITDLIHYEPDGFEMLKYLKENDETRSVPIMIISGQIRDTLTREYVLREGATEAIGKPYVFRDVLYRIYRILDPTYPSLN